MPWKPLYSRVVLTYCLTAFDLAADGRVDAVLGDEDAAGQAELLAQGALPEPDGVRVGERGKAVKEHNSVQSHVFKGTGWPAGRTGPAASGRHNCISKRASRTRPLLLVAGLEYAHHMSLDAMVEDTTHLLEVWVAGWAGCRGYETRKEGRFPAALRADTTHEWEYFAHDPSDSEFAELAAKTAEVPARVLTILTNDVARYTVLAQQHGLNVTSASQTMMIVDMETQDSEDPWLSG